MEGAKPEKVLDFCGEKKTLNRICPQYIKNSVK